MNDHSGRRIVVAGAGFAGLAAAYMLKRRLGKGAQVTVISPSPYFYFAPSLIWTPFGGVAQPSLFDIEPALAARDIAFVRSPVHRVDAFRRSVVVDDGEIEFDRLLIATGGRPDARGIPGLAGQFREASWIVGEDSAMELRDVLRRAVENRAPIVVGVAQGASYASAAYELVLQIDTHLRSEGARDSIPLTFVTAEPRLGDLGFGQTAAEGPLQEIFADRDITAHVGAKIAEIRSGVVQLAGGMSIETGAAVIMPPMTGSVDIWKSAGLTDESGLIPVNPQYRHTTQEEIYAAGIASYFAQDVPPLPGRHAPHTGYLSLCMGAIAGVNIAASLGAGDPSPRTLPRIVDMRVLDGGEDGVFIASRGDTELHHSARRLSGETAHTLKESIETYLLDRLQTGLVGGFVPRESSEPVEA